MGKRLWLNRRSIRSVRARGNQRFLIRVFNRIRVSEGARFWLRFWQRFFRKRLRRWFCGSYRGKKGFRYRSRDTISCYADNFCPHFSWGRISVSKRNQLLNNARNNWRFLWLAICVHVVNCKNIDLFVSYDF